MLGRTQPCYLRRRDRLRRRRLLVGRRKTGPVLVPAARPILQLAVLLLSQLGTGPGLLQPGGQPPASSSAAASLLRTAPA